MPLAYWHTQDIGDGPQVFWWGTHGSTTDKPDSTRGFLFPYLDTTLSPRSVLECPSQAWGSYRPQGPAKSPTSTYGYNGYYLSPAKTPGWGETISHQRWKRLCDLDRPSDLFVFADTLLSPGSSSNTMPGNTALLDPPQLFERGAGWRTNEFPTTAFRHGQRHQRAGSAAAGRAVTGRADGGAHTVAPDPNAAGDLRHAIGSASVDNNPHYVPDASAWH